MLPQAATSRYVCKARPGHQVIVFPLLDYLPVFEHQDQVRISDYRQTVGDNEGGASFDEMVQSQADKALGFRIHAGHRIIQDQDGGIHEQRPGNHYSLLFTAGERQSSFPYPGVIALRQTFNKVVDLGGLGGLHYLLVGSIRPAKGNVLLDGIREQKDILLRHTYVPAQRSYSDLPYIDAIHQHPAAADIVKSGDEIGQGTLTAAGPTPAGPRFDRVVL